MRSALTLEPFADVLRRHGLADAPESPFPNDGWSGARLTFRERDGQRFVIKRDGPAWDWIARATLDGPLLREAWFAAHGPVLPPQLWAPYLGAGTDDTAGPDVCALLMPDLSGVLLPWEEAADLVTVGRAVGAMATLHAHGSTAAGIADGPWCPLPERLLPAVAPGRRALHPAGNPVGERFLAGWDAFDAAPAGRAPARRRTCRTT